MATESLLVKTKDNYVVVLTINYRDDADKQRIVQQNEQYFATVNYKDFDSSRFNSASVQLDSANTNFLQEEIYGYHYVREPQNFVNELKQVKYPRKVKKANTIHFDFTLQDDDFPEMVRNISYKVKPKDLIYKVKYNPATGKYEKENFQTLRATVNPSKRELTVYRNHFEFEPQDYAQLQQMIADFQKQRQSNPKLTLRDYTHSIKGAKAAALFSVYAFEQSCVDNIKSTVSHEVKHIKNMVFQDGLGLKDDYKLMSLDNMYRISAENERSAYLEQLITSVNEYLRKGDYNDFSMFGPENEDFVVRLMHANTEQERLSLATNHEEMVRSSLQFFEDKRRSYYDENQYQANVLSLAQSEPVSAQPDNDGSTFNRIRYLYYHFMIYNPATGKEESVNLAKYITPDLEVNITNDVRNKILNAAEKELKKRQLEYQKKVARGEVNPALLAPARALMRNSLRSHSFLNQIDSLSISTLLDDNTIISQPSTGTTPSQPIPDDKADWSDDLQKYWSKVEGYQELAKNNLEYSFKVKDTTLIYKDKNHVNISSNANFDIYVKLLKEPSSKNNIIEFADTLSKEQALMLYVACVNYGRKMKGSVPTDLSGINQLQGIPPAELNKFNHRTAQRGTTAAIIPPTVAKPPVSSIVQRRCANIR